MTDEELEKKATDWIRSQGWSEENLPSDEYVQMQMAYVAGAKENWCCGNCISYLTDEDDNGELTEFYHNRNKESGFCALRDLFYTVQKDSRPCEDWTGDKE